MLKLESDLAAVQRDLIVRIETPTGQFDRPATLRDIRDALLSHGLDAIESEAVDWGNSYPGRAEETATIEALEAEIAKLKDGSRTHKKPSP